MARSELVMDDVGMIYSMVKVLLFTPMPKPPATHPATHCSTSYYTPGHAMDDVGMIYSMVKVYFPF